MNPWINYWQANVSPTAAPSQSSHWWPAVSPSIAQLPSPPPAGTGANTMGYIGIGPFYEVESARPANPSWAPVTWQVVKPPEPPQPPHPPRPPQWGDIVWMVAPPPYPEIQSQNPTIWNNIPWQAANPIGNASQIMGPIWRNTWHIESAPPQTPPAQQPTTAEAPPPANQTQE